MQFAVTLCLFQATSAHFDYKPFLPLPNVPLYGRYAGMTPATDPRCDKANADMFFKFGLGNLAPPNACPADFEGAKAWGDAVNTGYAGLFAAMVKDVPQYDVERKEIEIDGVDGNKIPMTIYQGSSKTCYYHTHGGGMAILSSRVEPSPTMMKAITGKHGMTIVDVEFRNYLSNVDKNIEVAQFPAGLNDCYSGLEWLHAHKEELGCETIVNFGESGGGNLCLALSLKTLKEGRPELLDGSFCQCPEVVPDVFSERTPSMVENEGYFINGADQGFQNMIDHYTANAADKTNPLAWPINAGPEDMKGMKPVMITVNELDPLRDAGLEMYRNLLAGGVQAEARMIAGTLHGGDSPLGSQHIAESTLNAMLSFAAILRGKVLVEADPFQVPKANVEVKADA